MTPEALDMVAAAARLVPVRGGDGDSVAAAPAPAPAVSAPPQGSVGQAHLAAKLDYHPSYYVAPPAQVQAPQGSSGDGLSLGKPGAPSMVIGHGTTPHSALQYTLGPQRPAAYGTAAEASALAASSNLGHGPTSYGLLHFDHVE